MIYSKTPTMPNAKMSAAQIKLFLTSSERHEHTAISLSKYCLSLARNIDKQLFTVQ